MSELRNPLHVEGQGLTDVGRVRSVNQDSFLVDDAFGLYIVADGMGGHVGGEVASQLCSQEVREFLKRHPEVIHNTKLHPSAHVGHLLADAINFASTKIYEKALEDPFLKGMGTTATVLKIIDTTAYWAHVGDSRLYLYRSGFLYQLSHDHSIVSEQIRAGILTKEEAETHHLRNVITRSVGYQEEEDVDTSAIQMEPGDFFLLCSDGLHGKISDHEMALNLSKYRNTSLHEFIQLANDRGGEDNITVLVVKVGT